MILKIILKRNSEKVKLILEKNANIIEELLCCKLNNLNQDLLKHLDIILKKNHFKLRDITEVKLISDLEAHFTANKIAQAIVNALNFSRKMLNNK